MICMTASDYEVYDRYYRKYRGTARPETLGRAFEVKREQVEYFENVYQQELSGMPIYVGAACSLGMIGAFGKP